MKTSASKILKFWLNKLKLNKSGNYLNKQTILISIIGIIILTTFLYFLRPVFFDRVYQVDFQDFSGFGINNIFKYPKSNYFG